MSTIKQQAKFFFIETFKKTKTDNYLFEYLNICNSIEQYKYEKRIHLFQILEFCIFLFASYFIYMHSKHFESDEQILNFDIIAYTGLNKKFNLVFSTLIFGMLYLFHQSYFAKKKYFFYEIRAILKNEQKHFFYWPFIYKKQKSIKFLKEKLFALLKILYIVCLLESNVLI